MYTLPDKTPFFADLEQCKKDEMKPNSEGFLGLYQRDTIAEQLKADIDSYSLQMYVDDTPRHHLGASVIGHYCIRYVWMHFRWVLKEKPLPRMARLWYRGHREEPIIIEQLRGIGCTVKFIEDDGSQLQIDRDDAEGHFGGSLDALIQLPTRYGLPAFWILLEMKSAGSQYYKTMTNAGVFKARKQYWSQMCVYAHKLTQSGKYGNIDYGLFYPVNKNNDEIEPEFVELDRQLGADEIKKAEDISQQYYPPPKLTNDANRWECKVCPMHKLCHLDEPYAVNCRSCRFAQPVENGQWMCHNFNQTIPKEYLIKGCDSWESLPR